MTTYQLDVAEFFDLQGTALYQELFPGYTEAELIEIFSILPFEVRMHYYVRGLILEAYFASAYRQLIVPRPVNYLHPSHPFLILSFKRRAWNITLYSQFYNCIFAFTTGMFLPQLYRINQRPRHIRHAFLEHLRGLKKKDRQRERKRLGRIHWKCMRHHRSTRVLLLRYVKLLLYHSGLVWLDIVVHGTGIRRWAWILQALLLHPVDELARKKWYVRWRISRGLTRHDPMSWFWRKRRWRTHINTFRFRYAYFTNKVEYQRKTRYIKRKIRKRLRIN